MKRKGKQGAVVEGEGRGIEGHMAVFLASLRAIPLIPDVDIKTAESAKQALAIVQEAKEKVDERAAVARALKQMMLQHTHSAEIH